MEVKDQYGKSRVVVINVWQNDVDGILINWDLKKGGAVAPPFFICGLLRTWVSFWGR